jgi:hypothetical protein
MRRSVHTSRPLKVLMSSRIREASATAGSAVTLRFIRILLLCARYRGI